MRKWGCVKICQIVVCAMILLQSGAAFCYDPIERFSRAKIVLPAPGSVQAEKYLGLKRMGPFKISDIKAKLVVIEFMSAVCSHCLSNAPIMNNIYRTIQENPGLADVKVIAIAVLSLRPEVAAFEEEFKPPFPVLIDDNGAIMASMGNMPTPTTMIVSTRSGKALYGHVGVIWNPEGFLGRLETLQKEKQQQQ